MDFILLIPFKINIASIDIVFIFLRKNAHGQNDDKCLKPNIRSYYVTFRLNGTNHLILYLNFCASFMSACVTQFIRNEIKYKTWLREI